jgi:hypothetical protein
MRFDTEPIGPDREVTGTRRHFELPERIAHHLVLAGVEVPPAFELAAKESAPTRDLA